VLRDRPELYSEHVREYNEILQQQVQKGRHDDMSDSYSDDDEEEDELDGGADEDEEDGDKEKRRAKSKAKCWPKVPGNTVRVARPKSSRAKAFSVRGAETNCRDPTNQSQLPDLSWCRGGFCIPLP
jgi:hypothetical protein